MEPGIFLLKVLVLFFCYVPMAVFYYALLEPKYGFWKCARIFYAVALLFSLISRAIEPWTDIPLVAVPYMVFEIATTILVWKKLSYTKLPKLLLVFLIQFTIMAVGSAVGRVLYGVVMQPYGGAADDNSLLSMGITAFCQTMLYLLTVRVLQRVLKKQTGEPKWWAFIWVMAAEMVGVLLVAWLTFWSHESKLTFYLINFGYILVCAFADWYLFRTFQSMVKNAELEQEMMLLNQQQALQRDAYLNMNEQISQLRRIRHDHTNALTTIDALLDTGDTAGARAFIASLEALARKKTYGTQTGSQIVDAVLSNKWQAAAEKDISFSAEMLWPKEVCVSDADLMSLFSNLLDNAIEYCEKLPEGQPREIRVSTVLQGKMLLIDVGNTYLGDVPPEIDARVTSKPDARLHGFGLGIVRRIAESYGGAVSAACSDGMLHLRVLLCIGATEPAV